MEKVNVIIGISKSYGLEVFEVERQPVNSYSFVAAMRRCEDNYGSFTIMGYGISYHHSKFSIKECTKI